jgi:prepilin-type N-terminal cleavage/methylation domain-containing protein
MNSLLQSRSPRRLRGFSLLEMAIVLVIVGLLLGGLLGSVGALQQRQRLAQTQAQLDEIRDALVAFAAVNGRLPCPADPATPNTTPGAGLERAPTAAGCTGGTSGVLPWATLSLSESDAWGRRFSYRVSAAFARAPAGINLTTTGDNVVRNSAAVVLAAAVPAVVFSHGENTRGSRGPSGALAAGSADAREQENADADTEFVADTPAGAYDDLVQWVPGPVLMHRLLQAGTLP